MLIYVHRDHRDYSGREAQNGNLDSHTAPELCAIVQVQCCFTETIRTIRDGEPRTATSTFTQLLSSVLLFKFNVALRPQRPLGLLQC